MADLQRRNILRATAMGAAGLGFAALGCTRASAQRAAPLQMPTGVAAWLNTAPLTSADFAGKVVLVNFWTYSCINSLRALPYLRDWAGKYRDRGLIVLGAHAPEFAFEHDVVRVRQASAAEGVTYPVVIDNDFAIWRAFRNQAWPGFFLVDRQGRIAHSAFGEGVYGELESEMQRLLSEGVAPVRDGLSQLAGEGAQLQADWDDLKSPETYVGSDKAENFTGGDLHANRAFHYEAGQHVAINQWTLSGDWKIGHEFASPAGAGSKLRFRFHARDLHMVLGREEGAAPVRYRVSLDGAPPQAAQGVDADAGGEGVIDADRMYQLVRQRGPIGPRTFEIEFLGPGARAYVFTFG